jgi:CBS domain-containing protein
VTMRRSIMTEKIARRGYHIYREYGVDPLERHHVDEVMTASVDSIDADMTVGAALDTFFGAKQTRRAYPVVREGVVIGVADRALLEQFRDENPDLRSAMNLDSVFDRRSAVFALPTETCRLVATRLAVHSLERLPVVADSKSMRLIGIVSRSDLVKPSLTYFEEEHKKERFRRLTLTRTKRRFAPIGKAG